MWPLPWTSEQSPPPPSPAHTLSHLSTPPAVSHAVSQPLPSWDTLTPSPQPHPQPTLTADWSFQVTSDLFPCLPNITGWPRPRNPAWAKEGAEVHTHKHNYTQKKPSHTWHERVWLAPCFVPYSAQHISAHPLVIHGGVVVWGYISLRYVSDGATNKHKCKEIAFIQPLWKWGYFYVTRSNQLHHFATRLNLYSTEDLPLRPSESLWITLKHNTTVKVCLSPSLFLSHFFFSFIFSHLNVWIINK